MDTSIMDKQQTLENGQHATKAEPIPNTHLATLVRGESYTLGNVVFKPGIRVPVPEYVKKHLMHTAIDQVDVEGEAEDKQKFAFEVIGEERGEAPSAPAPRGRRVPRTAA